jgi:hypothetical protein
MTEMYSGVIPLNMSDDSRGMFFIFQPRVGPPVDEITIWFNGGPGKQLHLFCEGQAPKLITSQAAALSKASSKRMAGSNGPGASIRLVSIPIRG